MKKRNEKCSGKSGLEQSVLKRVAWNKYVQKTLVTLHERYLWGSLLLKLCEPFLKIYSSTSIFEKSDQFQLATFMNFS